MGAAHLLRDLLTRNLWAGMEKQPLLFSSRETERVFHLSGAQKTMKILYPAKATVQGGRNGQAQSSDGHLHVHLSV